MPTAYHDVALLAPGPHLNTPGPLALSGHLPGAGARNLGISLKFSLSQLPHCPSVREPPQDTQTHLLHCHGLRLGHSHTHLGCHVASNCWPCSPSALIG